MSALSPSTGKGFLASFDYLDSAVDAIENLRKAGFKKIKAYAPYPEHHIEAALGYGQSRCGSSPWWVRSPVRPPVSPSPRGRPWTGRWWWEANPSSPFRRT